MEQQEEAVGGRVHSEESPTQSGSGLRGNPTGALPPPWATSVQTLKPPRPPDQDLLPTPREVCGTPARCYFIPRVSARPSVEKRGPTFAHFVDKETEAPTQGRELGMWPRFPEGGRKKQRQDWNPGLPGPRFKPSLLLHLACLPQCAPSDWDRSLPQSAG